MIVSHLRRVALAGVLLWPGPALPDAMLLMFDQPGCHWCAKWDAEIGPVYSKTAEAATAPLSRQDIHAPLPEGVRLDSPPQFTPTFVLLEDGREIGRIEGYPGADFFWGLLDALIAELPQPTGGSDEF